MEVTDDGEVLWTNHVSSTRVQSTLITASGVSATVAMLQFIAKRGVRQKVARV